MGVGLLAARDKENMMSTRTFKIAVPAALTMLAGNAISAAEISGATFHESFSKTGLTDFSAAQQKKKKRTAQAAPAPRPQAWGWGGGWKPADPSFDQNGRPYQPPPGLSCPVDLGYGRWASCNDDL